MEFVTSANFITPEEAEVVRGFKQPVLTEIQNYHIKSVSDAVNGWTAMYDFSKTTLSQEITKFQGDGTVITEAPDYFEKLGHRIADFVGISAEHMFFQYIVIGPGGMVKKHYDAGKPGHVTYKCNVCVEGPATDVIYVDKQTIPIAPLTLYCFEANLYKHWINAADVRRIHLSYGFILPCSDLGWKPDSPRLRLSDRIWKTYIAR